MVDSLFTSTADLENVKPSCGTKTRKGNKRKRTIAIKNGYINFIDVFRDLM